MKRPRTDDAAGTGTGTALDWCSWQIQRAGCGLIKPLEDNGEPVDVKLWSLLFLLLPEIYPEGFKR